LYLGSQIRKFGHEMKKAIQQKIEEEEQKPKKAREEAIQEITKFAEEN